MVPAPLPDSVGPQGKIGFADLNQYCWHLHRHPHEKQNIQDFLRVVLPARLKAVVERLKLAEALTVADVLGGDYEQIKTAADLAEAIRKRSVDVVLTLHHIPW
jgi:hypothetical protein